MNWQILKCFGYMLFGMIISEIGYMLNISKITWGHIMLNSIVLIGLVVVYLIKNRGEG